MFWLYRWLDERGVSSPAEAERVLRDQRQLADLRDSAAAVPYTTEPREDANGVALLAGRGVDLSGDLDCFAWSCRKRQVDTLLGRAWHYFDQVVAVGSSAYRVARDLGDEPDDATMARLRSDLRLLLYLRELGAESLVVFRQKPPPCELHVETHSREVGLDPALDRLGELAERLAPEAEVETRPHGDHLHYSFTHPRFEHTVWGAVTPTGSDVALDVAKAVLGRYMAHLTSDVRTARILDLPLGSTIQLHGDLLGLTPAAPSPADVMFNLRLPVLDGVDVRTLLKLREQEAEYFARFRDALRIAAGERLKDEGSDPKVAAEPVEREVIEPALIDINVRLKAAADTLAAKTRLTTRLGAALTACGVYFGDPLITTAGIAAAGASVQAIMKNADDFGEMRLSDMFFLWQAQHHAH